VEKINLFWFRRDLRTDDNRGLFEALTSGLPVLPVFIFDTEILGKLSDVQDARVCFIYQQIARLKAELENLGSSLKVFHGKPLDVFGQLLAEYQVNAVFTNNDYEPQAISRDLAVEAFLKTKEVDFLSVKNDVIFEKNEVVKADGKPYTVFTPYSKIWKQKFYQSTNVEFPSEKHLHQLIKIPPNWMPTLEEIGFKPSAILAPELIVDENIIRNYHLNRDFPDRNGTSRLSVHLRFGTISIRRLVKMAAELSETYLNELIWREFYKAILWHFPQVENKAFKPEYDRIEWSNDERAFDAWCKGETGYPIVDAGMRELNLTGLMHNRVRMITASFLIKHLLIDWRWGEAYFAEKLLDFELASNNGGWQWAASSGCDAVPYFRIFNPTLQTQKFDPELKYIRQYVPEFEQLTYPRPIVEHNFARERVLRVFKKALS
jgi:deoxyribodipyrimidine photo-lyase